MLEGEGVGGRHAAVSVEGRKSGGCFMELKRTAEHSHVERLGWTSPELWSKSRK